jgi:recombination protein U
MGDNFLDSFMDAHNLFSEGCDMSNTVYTGKRGMAFEERLNATNKLYQTRKIALINKRPTPIKVIKSQGTKVLSGFFESKSTVDYDGIYKGRPIVFEAKSVSVDRFDLSNLHVHQLNYLEEADRQGALSFVLIEFKNKKDIYLCTLSMIQHYVRLASSGGRKSIPYDDFDIYGNLVEDTGRATLDYLKIVDKLVESETG